jgi:ribose transport system substrate-binding protein
MKLTRTCQGFAIVAVTTMAVTTLAACSSSGTSGGSSGPSAATGSSNSSSSASGSGKITPVNATQNPPTSSLCGSKSLSIDYLAAYSTPWQQISYAEFKKEAAACPNVKTSFLSADGDTQKSISNIQSAAAQGANAIVIYPVGGQAELPAMRQALKSGTAVVPFDNSVGGTAGQDYTTYVGLDLAAAGAQQADWLGKQLGGKGSVVYLGGPAGSSFTQEVFNGWKATLTKSYPGIQILTGGPVATDYSSSNTQQVMAGLFARFPKIDAVEADYGAAGVGALRAFTASNKPFPNFATMATSNELGCAWKQSTSSTAKLFSLDGTTLLSRIAFRKALAAAAGTTDPESSTVTAFVSADTAAGTAPKCESSLPPAADLSGDLTVAEMQQLLK